MRQVRPLDSFNLAHCPKLARGLLQLFERREAIFVQLRDLARDRFKSFAYRGHRVHRGFYRRKAPAGDSSEHCGGEKDGFGLIGYQHGKPGAVRNQLADERMAPTSAAQHDQSIPAPCFRLARMI